MDTLPVRHPAAFPTKGQVEAYYDGIFAHDAYNGRKQYNESLGLDITIEPDLLSLGGHDLAYGYEFVAQRSMERFGWTVSFSICNQIGTSHHPLIYPAQLMGRAVGWFEANGGVDALQGEWLPPPARSVNYQAYIWALYQIPRRPPSDTDKANAALATWTGRQFARLGYGCVQEVAVVNFGAIQPTFVRH